MNNKNNESVMTVADYLIMVLLLSIPFVNIYLIIKWAIGGETINKNKTNYVRAMLIFIIPYMALILFIIAVLILSIPAMSIYTEQNITNIMQGFKIC